MLPLIFINPISTETPLPEAKQLIVSENKIDINEVVHKDYLGKIKNPAIEKLKQDKAEMEKKKAEEQNINEVENKVYYDFVLTYYALLQEECGKTDGITASGKRISRGMIASPKVFKFGTKIVIEGNEYTVEDRGSNKYIKVNNDGSIRLDIYIPRLKNETNRQYSKRVNDMGVKRVKGYVLK